MGKFGSFPAAELVGQLYGLRYDIAEKTLKVIAPPSIEDVGGYWNNVSCPS